jgi:hypothetical protein
VAVIIISLKNKKIWYLGLRLISILLNNWQNSVDINLLRHIIIFILLNSIEDEFVLEVLTDHYLNVEFTGSHFELLLNII